MFRQYFGWAQPSKYYIAHICMMGILRKYLPFWKWFVCMNCASKYSLVLELCVSNHERKVQGTLSILDVLFHWTNELQQTLYWSYASEVLHSRGLLVCLCRPAPGASVDQLGYQRISLSTNQPINESTLVARTLNSLRQYHPYTSTSLVGTWGNTNFVPILLYQPQIILGPINRTRLVWKFWKKYPISIPIPTWYAEKKGPLIYQDQAGMFDARPTLVESPKVQNPERNFVFLAFLWHPWKGGVFNMLLNFSCSSFVAGQGSFAAWKTERGSKRNDLVARLCLGLSPDSTL